MKKKIYASPSCEAIPFADEVLLSAATNPKKKEDEDPSNTNRDLPIDNSSGKMITDPGQIF